VAGDTLADRYERIARLEQITQAGYKVEVPWECNFHEGILAVHPELKTHPIVHHEPLNTRNALNRCRTEAMRLHYKIAEGETIQF
jgi:G:T-mismatch repair DNA endonuclease (very short patch repair protein)